MEDTECDLVLSRNILFSTALCLAAEYLVFPDIVSNNLGHFSIVRNTSRLVLTLQSVEYYWLLAS